MIIAFTPKHPEIMYVSTMTSSTGRSPGASTAARSCVHHGHVHSLHGLRARRRQDSGGGTSSHSLFPRRAQGRVFLFGQLQGTRSGREGARRDAPDCHSAQASDQCLRGEPSRRETSEPCWRALAHRCYRQDFLRASGPSPGDTTPSPPRLSAGRTERPPHG